MKTSIPLMVSIDTECDKSSTWHTRFPLGFRGVAEGVGERLHPLFREFDIRPTYLLSTEVICDIPSRNLFRTLDGCELGTHLHGEYTSPGALPALGGTLTHDMQWQYKGEVEQAKLETLTHLFMQQFGYRPRSFRAGRFGIGHQTGRFLTDLGYHTDSSVTPHIVWTSRDGIKFPDFRGFRETPYRVGMDGDIWEEGASTLLELPVTVLPAGTLAGAEGPDPVWFRPWYSSQDVLKRIVTRLLEDAERTGVVRPLVMMFHNVEAVPGLSPYPQTPSDVEIYLDMLRGTFDHALSHGIAPCTFEEYYSASFHKTNDADETAAGMSSDIVRSLDKTLSIPEAGVLPSLERHNVEPWFSYIFRERASRWDVWQPCHWIAQHLPTNACILETGCGTGFNLLWLAEQGFTNLCGFDICENAVNAGMEIAETAGLTVELWVDDGLAPVHLRNQKFSAIIALNWAHLIPGMSYERLLKTYLPYLTDDGVFILDAIDAAYNNVQDNQYHTWDRAKPVQERRPSEYCTRVSTDDVAQFSAALGLSVETILTEEQAIPKKVYILRRKAVNAATAGETAA